VPATPSPSGGESGSQPPALWSLLPLSCGAFGPGRALALVCESYEHPSFDRSGVPEIGGTVFMKLLPDRPQRFEQVFWLPLLSAPAAIRPKFIGGAAISRFMTRGSRPEGGRLVGGVVPGAYVGGEAWFVSTTSAQVPVRRRVLRCWGLATTWPLSSNPCFALKERIRSRL
jgi:hypothetical protein